MKGSRFTTEQIIMKLREMEIHISQGMSVSEAVHQIRISDATYYKWRSKYANMTTRLLQRSQHTPVVTGWHYAHLL